ncbi:hypothetical protein T03_13224 [Trichinella britovi]|uniref:Uncharacterized protein n=1 Tax=Trichinella britovi TaxID=45882 RepID=A0A0V1CR61_TRIBR|nr:hypothetical protein T03_13224 [Trichinella britovi]
MPVTAYAFGSATATCSRALPKEFPLRLPTGCDINWATVIICHVSTFMCYVIFGRAAKILTKSVV